MGTRQAALEGPSNTFGAIIFVFYVLAALFLSSLICRDLIHAYVYLPKRSRERPELFRNLQIFTAFSILSFAVLSYHMMDYLIESYLAWATERHIVLPHRIYGQNGLLGPREYRTTLHIWTWLRTSTLFQDFARTICAPYEHACWTSHALFATLGWNLVFSIEGPWRKIKHLWAYVLLSQVLPVSFAQNLFLLAILLKDTSKTGGKVWAPNTVVLAVPLCLYGSLVLVAPYVVDSQYFITIVASVRMLLFWPLIAVTTLPEYAGNHLTVAEVRRRETWFLATIVIFSVMVDCGLTFMPPGSGDLGNVGLFKILVSVNDDPSVSALGYDYIIGMLSACAWLLFVDDAPAKPQQPEKQAMC